MKTWPSSSYSPKRRVSTTYRGYKVYKPGFWSQGPSMLEALNILEGYDLRAMKYNSAEYLHTLAEALKLAYADRDTYYGDPKFVKIPAERLLSKEYAAERRKQIGADGLAWISARARSAIIRRCIRRSRRSCASRSTMP